MGGAKAVTAIDTSSDSLLLLNKNIEINEFPKESVETLAGDVSSKLRKFRDEGRKFDLIILDPPKFAPTSSSIQRAARGYKDINLLAMKLLNDEGILATFSCSGAVTMDLFQKIVAGAALDAGVDGRIIYRLYQGLDHPVGLNFPEGQYLKGLVIKVFSDK